MGQRLRRVQKKYDIHASFSQLPGVNNCASDSVKRTLLFDIITFVILFLQFVFTICVQFAYVYLIMYDVRKTECNEKKEKI